MSSVYRKKCDGCGKSIEEESIFCGHCGKRLDPANVKVHDSSTILRAPDTSSTTFVHPHAPTTDFYQTIPAPDENRDQQVQQGEVLEQKEEDHWLNLKWFILISAVFSIILLPVGIVVHTQIVIAAIIILALVSIVLAVIQSFYFRQWYWLACILLLGPVTCIIYSIYNPIVKQNLSYPPRQLILLGLFPGIVLFLVGIIMLPQSPYPWYDQIYWIFGVDLMAMGYIITLFRVFIKGEGDWLSWVIVFNVLGAVCYALSSD